MSKFTNRLVLVFNALAALALLVAYLAPVVNPAKLFMPALFGLAYPYILVLNLIFIIYWMIRMKKEILLSIVVILLGWNHLNNLLPINFRPSEVPVNAAPGQLLHVLSYNVRAFDMYHWNEDQGARDGIFEFIRKEDPDLLCLQEYYISNKVGQRVEDVTEKLKTLSHRAVFHPADPNNLKGFGIATYSKYPIIKKSRIPFSSSSNAAIYTDIRIHYDTIRVFNVHLQSIRFEDDNYAFIDTAKLTYNNEQMQEIKAIGSRLKRAFIQRSEQAEMIANYIDESPHPVVVLGDFNDTPHSYAYRKIRKGLHDAYRKAGRGFGSTYAGKLPALRIDYILYQDPFIPGEYKRFRTKNSDHYPISSRLYLP